MPEFIIKAMYKSELADAYGVSPKVFGQWLSDLPAAMKKKIGDISGRRVLKPFQVKIIVSHFDPPY